ncbi:MAG: hypothetical protein DRR06_19910 [Gammaproteobacteria bacterium]|nr:MAG: hypothetical protein DRR06_19910 [Gammaproteobacteria bacterium]
MLVKKINRTNDEEIINLIREILTAGNMVVETYNEAVLVGLMKHRGTPIEYKKSIRDIDRDFRHWWDDLDTV